MQIIIHPSDYEQLALIVSNLALIDINVDVVVGTPWYIWECELPFKMERRQHENGKQVKSIFSIG